MIWYLIARSREISKPWDWYFKLSFRSGIWHARRQQCCRFTWQISERPYNSKYESCGFGILWVLTSYLILKRGPGAHFTNNFSITFQMWWKFHFALIKILIKWSLQYLAHGTTAGLSWHVPNVVAIWSSVVELELNEISITFELWWKNR